MEILYLSHDSKYDPGDLSCYIIDTNNHKTKLKLCTNTTDIEF